jgi:hypothetical protein
MHQQHAPLLTTPAPGVTTTFEQQYQKMVCANMFVPKHSERKYVGENSREDETKKT